MHAYLTRYSGASHIIMIDNNKIRIEIVSALGIADTLVFSSAQDVHREILCVTNGEGVDSVIVAYSSTDAQRAVFTISGIRGKISLFVRVPPRDRMVKIDTNDIHYLEKSVFGAFASTHHQYRKALELIMSKKMSLKKPISKVLLLESFNEGIDLLTGGRALKVVIKPNVGDKE